MDKLPKTPRKEASSPRICGGCQEVRERLIRLETEFKEYKTSNQTAFDVYRADSGSALQTFRVDHSSKLSVLATQMDEMHTWRAISVNEHIHYTESIKSLEEKEEASYSRINALENWKNKLLGIGAVIVVLAGVLGAILEHTFAG